MKCLHKLNQYGWNIVFGRSKHYFKYIISNNIYAMYESGLKTLGLVEQVGCVTRGSTGGIVLHVFYL